MSKSAIITLIAAVCALSPGITRCATAQPRLAGANDPDAADVRSVAADLFTRISAGDRAGARELFDGPKDQAALLETCLDLVEASERLRKTIAAKFGEADATTGAIAAAGSFKTRGARMASKLVIINGDRATVAAGPLLDAGLSLVRVNGKWRVTYLANSRRAAAGSQAFYAELARGMDEVRLAIETGKITTADATRRELEKHAEVAYRKDREAEDAALSLPPPAAPPGQAAPALADLLAVVGKSLRSDEAQTLLGQMPGAPRLQVFQDVAYLNSEEWGVSLAMSGSNAAVGAIFLYVGGEPDFAKYTGQLPHGLALSDQRRDVERKLGRPPVCGKAAHLYAVYSTLGLSVDYLRPDGRDPSNPLYSVMLRAPDPYAEAPSTQPAPPGPRLAFRLVAKAGTPDEQAAAAAAERLEDQDNPDHPLPLLREVLLDERAVADVNLSVASPADQQQPAITIKMTPAGAEQLRRITREHIGWQLALVLDGRVLIAPTIRDEIGENVSLTMRGGDDPKQAAKLVGKIETIINTLPPEPATTTTTPTATRPRG